MSGSYEYAGFLFEIIDGKLRALPGQHDAAYKDKHLRAAQECYDLDFKTQEKEMFFEQSYARDIAAQLIYDLKSKRLTRISIEEVKASVSGFRSCMEAHEKTMTDKEADALVELVLRRVVERAA